jgi:hypothetical protein
LLDRDRTTNGSEWQQLRKGGCGEESSLNGERAFYDGTWFAGILCQKGGNVVILLKKE